MTDQTIPGVKMVERHTTGPWKDRHGAISGPSGMIIADVHEDHHNGMTEDEWEDNRRLIENAPALQQALKAEHAERKALEAENEALRIELSNLLAYAENAKMEDEDDQYALDNNVQSARSVLNTQHAERAESE